MLQVSDKFKKGCNSDSLKYREYIIIDGKQVDIKGNLSATAYKDTTFFGTFNMKMLTFQTENDINYKKKEFIYYKEVDGESVKIGTFIVTEVKDSDTFEQVNVTAYDYALKFANRYNTELDYKSGTVRLIDVIGECCNKCGVELETTNIINGNVKIEESPDIPDLQFGTVIAYASALQGKFATINENNKLEFVLENETVGLGLELITEDRFNLTTENDELLLTNEYETIEDYVELDDKRDTRPITCISVGIEGEEGFESIAKDEALIEKYGENWLRIINNSLVKSNSRALEFAQGILDNLKGFGYTSFESKYTFKPYLKLGDVVQIKRTDGTTQKSNVLRITSNFDDITLSAPSIINASVEYEQPTTAYDGVKNAYAMIDKANGQVVLKADKDGKIVQAELNSSASEGSEFNVKADNIKLEGYTTINGNFKIDERGNMECKDSKMTSVNVDGGSIILNSGSMTDEVLRVINPNDTHFAEMNAFWLRMGYDGENKIIMQSQSGAIRCVTLVQTSLEENKKNFEKFDNALEVINNTDIYKYNFKSEDDNQKKHIGFIIGENFKYSSEMTAIDEEGKEIGVDNYSMTSVCLQAIKEQQEQIDLLKKQLSDIINKEAR